MDLSGSFSVWRRRWLLTALLLILTLLGAATAATRMRTYQSAASVILLASRSAARANGGNPYLSFSPTLTLTADALSREMTSPLAARHLAAMGYSGSYTVALAPYTTNTTGSVLLVTVTGGDKAAVGRTLAGVTSQLSADLLQLQSGVAARGRIRDATLSYTPRARLSVSATARPVIMVSALGLLIGLGIPLVVDGRIARRQPRAGRWGHAASKRSAISS